MGKEKKLIKRGEMEEGMKEEGEGETPAVYTRGRGSS